MRFLHSLRPRAHRGPRRRLSTRVFVLGLAGALSLSLGVVSSWTKSTHVLAHRQVSRAALVADNTGYPVGVADASEPSGYAPPGADALPGYAESYVNDFSGSLLPKDWGTFAGEPGSDPGALWSASHVGVANGMLQLDTFQDGSDGQWVSGGVCQCGHSQTYGAYFVRSRLTGPGPTQVELLWPVNGWPPEIDFDETYGDTNSSMATVHFDSSNDQIQNTVNVDMTQWHTWGVIWTPTSITFTLDGNVWATVTQPSAIPDQPMTLDIQQQTWCTSNYACPDSFESTDVDWVAEYTQSTSAATTTTTTASTTTSGSTPTTTTTSPTKTHRSNKNPSVSVRPFAQNSWALSDALKAQISQLAKRIRDDNASLVALQGYSAESSNRSKAIAISKERALVVERYLQNRLRALKDERVTIKIYGEGSSDPVASNATPSGRALNRRVVALIS